MKKLLLYFIILHLLQFQLSTNIVASQTIESYDPYREVYWFNVKIMNITDPQTQQKKYNLVLLGKKVYNGTARDYEKKLWEGTSAGTFITVGPFETYNEANEAMIYYDTKRKPDESTETDNKYNWFLLKVNIQERSRSYKFERMAAAIASGTIREFEDILRESLTFKVLAIGPFRDALDAEESKRIYRLEE